MSEDAESVTAAEAESVTAEIGYAEAMAEIEAILEELEGPDPDVDVLADQVGRAAELIAVCRERITAAELQVEQVMASLDDRDGGNGGADADG